MARPLSSTLRRVGSQDQTLSWTDDLPVCYLSGVGFSTNQVYREDGNRREMHEFEDQSLHFKVDGNYLYGVFDGHDGCKVSKFAAQRMPAELLLGQLYGKTTDEQIKEVLTEAFEAVDKGYFESIDDALAEKAKLEIHVPEGMSYEKASQEFPELMRQLSAKETEIKGGTMAVVALIIDNRLFVANVGCSRALLCKTDEKGTLWLSQLTVDHNLDNEAELKRLLELGLDVEKLRQVGKLGNIGYTRTIGDHQEKRAYKDIEMLSTASSEPVIVEPEIYGGIDIDANCRFLILMSDGLYKSLEDATGTDHVNTEIASMVASEFCQQSTLNGVAQAVVDKVVRKHHDTFMMRKTVCQKRDDITLLVRNFNYPLANAISSPQTPPKESPATKQSLSPLSVLIPGATSPGRSPPQLHLAPQRLAPPQPQIYTNTKTVRSTLTSTLSSHYTSSNDSTQSSEEHSKSQSKQYVLPLDEHGKIEAYVGFGAFYDAMNKLSDEERKNLDAEFEPKPDFETIIEEKEPESEPTTPSSNFDITAL